MWNDRTALGSVPEPHNVVEEPYNSEKQNWVGDNCATSTEPWIKPDYCPGPGLGVRNDDCRARTVRAEGPHDCATSRQPHF